MNRLIVLSVISLFLASIAMAEQNLDLHPLFTDGMVLQRDRIVPVRGSAAPGEEVLVEIAGQELRAKADDKGCWEVKLDPVPAGGPFEMTVTGKETIVLKNVMFGDVWICSGQSNMVWPVRRSDNSAAEIESATYPEIRLFKVKRRIAYQPTNELSGEWRVCSPETVPDFSGVGFFFGRELFKTLKTPIGLIQTAWGGTPAESWTPVAALKRYEVTRPIVTRNQWALETYGRSGKTQTELSKSFFHQDPGPRDSVKKWVETDFDDSLWKTMALPTPWETTMKIDGAVWFRKKIDIPASWANRTLRLNLGKIDDFDITWFNGVRVGATGKETKHSWRVQRRYTIPAEKVKPGPAVIAVRVFDHYGGGGFMGPEKSMFIEVSNGAQPPIALSGDWRYKIELELKQPGQVPLAPTSPHIPACLYNGMIHPLIKFPVKGTIWYQGESNADRAFQYRTLLKVMIRQWREQWGQGDFPFLIVQLANFRHPVTKPGESAWAELREAQSMAQELPNTGLACAIDIGETDTIHPGNKQDVGRRLALAARKIAYDENVVYSGPTYTGYSREGNIIRLTFDNVGSGLVAKGGELKHFAIAGKDREFVWAKAEIDGDTVRVWSDKVRDPVAVRYGWAKNPAGCNLYNAEGLPAAPFRTDSWPGITVDQR